MSEVSIVKCFSYDEDLVFRKLKELISNLGGIEKFIKKGERILLKPNLVSPKEPERAITTHPAVLKAIIKLVKEAGAVPYVGDSPIGSFEKNGSGRLMKIDKFWERTGIKKVCDEEEAKMVSFESSGVKEFNSSLKKIKIHISRKIFEFDAVINLPKLKTHSLTLLTGAIKNLFGTVPGIRKAEYHKQAVTPKNFSYILVDIFEIVGPKLNIVDGITAMDGDGPSNGRVIKPGILVAGGDALSVDVILADILGIKKEKIEYLKIAMERGLGEGEKERIFVKGEKLDSVKIRDSKKPKNFYMYYIPQWLMDFLGKFVWARPKINKNTCIKCKKCMLNCPMEAIYICEDTTLEIDYSKCINCLCCQESCEYSSVDIELSPLAKLIVKK